MSDTEEIKALLTQIRDEQRMHREEWTRAQAENQQLRLQTQMNLKKAKQMRLIMFIVIVVLLTACTLVPLLQWVVAFTSSGTLHVHTQ